jgi:methionyl-tRNA formyltransferase
MKSGKGHDSLAKVVFLGHNSYGVFVMNYLLQKGHQIPCVIVPPTSTPDKIQAVRQALPRAEIVEGKRLSGPEMAEVIKRYDYNTVLSCSYKGIIPKEVIRLGVINIHGAILPEWRGANMLNWVIIKGCSKSGITLHYMDETLDTGDIIDIIEYPINYEDDVNTVKQRMFQKTAELFDRCWEPLLNGQIKAKPQDHSLARYYPARRPEDGRIDWSQNAVDIYNLIRALVEPYPGAFCYAKGEKLIIEKAEVEIDNRPHFKPGKVLSVGEGAACRVSTGYNLLVVRKLRDSKAIEKVGLKEGDYLE